MSTRLFAAAQQRIAPKAPAQPIRRELRPLSQDLLARVGGGTPTGKWSTTK